MISEMTVRLISKMTVRDEGDDVRSVRNDWLGDCSRLTDTKYCSKRMLPVRLNKCLLPKSVDVYTRFRQVSPAYHSRSTWGEQLLGETEFRHHVTD